MSQFVDHAWGLLIPICLGMGGLPAYAQVSNPPVESTKVADPFFLTRAKNLARQAAEQQNGGLNAYRAEGAMYGPAVDAPHVQNPDGSVTFTFKGGAPGFVTPTIETIAQVTVEGAVQLQYNGPLRSTPVANDVKPTQPQPPIQTPPNLPAPLEKAVPIPITPTPSVAPTQPLESLPPLPKSTAEPTNPSDLPTLPSPAAASPETIQKGSSVPTPPTAPVEPIRASTPPQPLSASTRNSDALADLFLSRARNLARQAAIKANGGLSQYRPEPSMFGPTAETPHTKNQDGSITFRFRGGSPGYQTPTVESVVTITANNQVTVTYNGPVRQ